MCHPLLDSEKLPDYSIRSLLRNSFETFLRAQGTDEEKKLSRKMAFIKVCPMATKEYGLRTGTYQQPLVH